LFSPRRLMHAMTSPRSCGMTMHDTWLTQDYQYKSTTLDTTLNGIKPSFSAPVFSEFQSNKQHLFTWIKYTFWTFCIVLIFSLHIRMMFRRQLPSKHCTYVQWKYQDNAESSKSVF
jgi:hypothetical protein